MPDEDRQTIYISEKTGFEEWRCRYYTTSYRSSGGTGVVAKHLIDTHELLKESPRDTIAKNIQKSL
jgi:hypothetical protein